MKRSRGRAPSTRLCVELDVDPCSVPRSCADRQKECSGRLLGLARRLARRCALRHPLRLVTSDDVAEALARYGHGPCALGLAAGLLFRRPEWHLTCFRVRSRRPSSRGREIKVWQLARPKDGCAAKPAEATLPGVLVADHRSIHPVPAEASTEEPMTCSLCEEISSTCLGFCKWVFGPEPKL
jgi:hypothetical protein